VTEEAIVSVSEPPLPLAPLLPLPLPLPLSLPLLLSLPLPLSSAPGTVTDQVPHGRTSRQRPTLDS